MTASNATPKGLAGSVGFLLSKLSQRLVQEVAARLSDMGMQSRHVGVMIVVTEQGPTSQKAIGDALRIDRTTMVGLVDDLERLGFVTRSPDPNDRRSSLVSLSPQGVRALRQARSRIEEIEAEFLRPIPATVQKQFLSVLETLFNGET